MSEESYLKTREGKLACCYSLLDKADRPNIIKEHVMVMNFKLGGSGMILHKQTECVLYICRGRR